MYVSPAGHKEDNNPRISMTTEGASKTLGEITMWLGTTAVYLTTNEAKTLHYELDQALRDLYEQDHEHQWVIRVNGTIYCELCGAGRG